MFRPLHNRQKDLEDWDEMRSRALAYNPEEGDVDSRAPETVQPEGYDPEMGDVDETAPVAKEGPNPGNWRSFMPADDPRRVPAMAVAEPQARPAKHPALAAVADNKVAASVQAAPRKVERRDYGPKPTSRLASMVGTLGDLGAMMYGASRTGHPAITEAVQQVGRDSAEQNRFDEDQRGKYAWRKGKMQAAEQESAAAAEKDKRLRSRQEAQDKRQADRDAKFDARMERLENPDSPQNVRKREISLEAKKAETAEEESTHQRRRGEGIEDFEKKTKITAKHRRPLMTPWGYSPGGSEVEEDTAAVKQGLIDQYKGWENVPPGLKTKFALASTTRNKKAKKKALTDLAGDLPKKNELDDSYDKWFANNEKRLNDANAAEESLNQLEGMVNELEKKGVTTLPGEEKLIADPGTVIKREVAKRTGISMGDEDLGTTGMTAEEANTMARLKSLALASFVQENQNAANYESERQQAFDEIMSNRTIAGVKQALAQRRQRIAGTKNAILRGKPAKSRDEMTGRDAETSPAIPPPGGAAKKMRIRKPGASTFKTVDDTPKNREDAAANGYEVF